METADIPQDTLLLILVAGVTLLKLPVDQAQALWGYLIKVLSLCCDCSSLTIKPGATCYMNSLIQTLYMTPEFRYVVPDALARCPLLYRQAVYKWSFEEKYKRGKEEREQKEQKEQNGKGSNDTQAASSSSNNDRAEKEKMSIPLQLQRLFARLQLLDQQAVKTKVSKL